MKKFVLMSLIILMVILGLGILFYPDISDWYSGRLQVGLMQTFDEEVAGVDEAYIKEHFSRAQEYNEALYCGIPIQDPFPDSTKDDSELLPSSYYLETLNVGGMMAQLEIPIIGVQLPVFHTTSSESLSRGVGHMEGTSFPIGGKNTHAVLTGHSGLANARLFTDLEKVKIGDLFFITVLDSRLAYQVDKITMVLPHEIEELKIAEGTDCITLITCVPVAINTHRLLVHGVRIPYEPGMANEIVPISGVLDQRLFIVAAILLAFLFSLIINVIKKYVRKRRGRY